MNDVRVYLCLHCITVNNNNKIIDFLSENFFPYFFLEHLNILANFGTLVHCIGCSFKFPVKVEECIVNASGARS
jgi:hypothetical protein